MINIYTKLTQQALIGIYHFILRHPAQKDSTALKHQYYLCFFQSVWVINIHLSICEDVMAVWRNCYSIPL